MYEFGEELIIESYKVPWLIWIQLLVMILIVILLFYGFTIFSLDDDHDSTTASSSSTSTTQSHLVNNNNNSRLGIINNAYSHNTRVEENQNIKRNAGTSREIVEDEVQEREGSSIKDAINYRPLQHPCHYLGLAKQALLKCLGLDSGAESFGDRKQHKKED